MLAAAPPPARASAAPPAAIVVSAHAARAVVQTRPFRIAIQNRGHRTVLTEVANGRPLPQVLPPTQDPIPPGYDNPKTSTLYAPLSFLVGNETLEQQPSGEWIGNLASGSRSGIQYSARDVTAARKDGKGVLLTVSTSDPTGRTLSVDVQPRGSGAIRVAVSAHPSTGVVQIGDSFASDRGEGFFGFGGRHNALDQRGQVLSSFVNEENLSGVGNAGSPPVVSMFPNGPTAAYYPQPEFVSSHAYGFLVDQPELARFKLDADRADAWNVTASAQSLRYTVAPGSAPTAIRSLTGLSGRQPVPPKWALGPMLDRLVKNQDESYADYEAKLKDDQVQLKHYKLPITAYRIEGWGFPSVDNDGLALHTWVHPNLQQQLVHSLRRRHIHPLFYLRPWLQEDSAPVKKGYAVRDANGNPYYVVGSGNSRFAMVDFTNPAAVRWWQGEVKKVFDLGADGFMQDYGEQILFDMHFHDGSTGVTEHDDYLRRYARATRLEIRAYERKHPRRHLWFFTRAGYTGSPGSAAYEGGNFPGDETTDWEHLTGLQSLTSDMLNRAIGGAYGYGADIGGYLDYTTPPTTKELFLRWAEWAVFSPVFRLHGAGLRGTHTPWSFDAQTVRVYRHLSKLHEQAAPLILRLWRSAHKTGVPPTRPLWLEDPGDPGARAQDQEWMLGRDLLVAPVVSQGATSRTVHFPRGCWVRGKRRYRGRHSATVKAGLTTLPYFRRCGTHPLRRHA